MRESTYHRAWAFMLGMTAAFLWPVLVLLQGPAGLSGFGRLLGFHTTHPGAAGGWLLGALVATVFVGMSMRGYPFIRRHVFDLSYPALKAFALLFGSSAAVVEEIWFRKLPMDWMASHGGGAMAQLAFTALLFSLPHSVWGLAARSLRVLLGSLVATALLGAALGAVYLVAGRVIAPCIWAHAGINIILEPWLFIAALERGADGSRTGPRSSRDVAAHEAA